MPLNLKIAVVLLIFYKTNAKILIIPDASKSILKSRILIWFGTIPKTIQLEVNVLLDVAPELFNILSAIFAFHIDLTKFKAKSSLRMTQN